MSTTAKFTAGPWRWEFNRKHKVLHLVGGCPRYDLTIMDFDRWGMSGAVATLRDTAHDGFNIMHRLSDRTDWIAPFPGRAHHADWCSDVVHPDMRLMASAPELLEALEAALRVIVNECDLDDYPGPVAMIRDAIALATGAA